MYKKLSLFLALVLMLFIVVACSSPEAGASKDEPFDSKYVRVIVDKETGCEYVIFDRQISSGGTGGITPRLGHNGKPLCVMQNKNE